MQLDDGGRWELRRIGLLHRRANYVRNTGTNLVSYVILMRLCLTDERNKAVVGQDAEPVSRLNAWFTQSRDDSGVERCCNQGGDEGRKGAARCWGQEYSTWEDISLEMTPKEKESIHQAAMIKGGVPRTNVRCALRIQE